MGEWSSGSRGNDRAGQAGPTHPRPAGTRRIGALTVATALVLLAGVFGAWTLQDFGAAERRARDELDASSELLELGVARSIASIDGALQGAADMLVESGLEAMRTAPAWSRLRSLQRPLPEATELYVYDLAGELVATTESFPPRKNNVTDREYFRHLSAGRSESYIGNALRGRTVHRWFFPVARAVRGADGRVVAVLQAGVPVDFLAVHVPGGGAVAGRSFAVYRDADGALVARSPLGASPVDETASRQPFFAPLAAEGASWRGDLDVAGARTFASARNVRGNSLIVVASVAREAALEPAYEALRVRGAAFLAAGAVVGFLGLRWRRAQAAEYASREAAREATIALGRSQERLRQALEAGLLISFEWDVVRNEVRRDLSVEPALAPTGRAAQTLETVLEAVHPEDRDRFMGAIHAAFEREDGRFESEFRIVRPDGSVAWLHERGRVERDSHGQPLRVVGVSFDVTQRRNAESMLRESEQRFRLALRHAPVSVAIQDRELRYVWAYNPFVAPPDDLLGRCNGELLPAEQARTLDALARRVLDEDVEVGERMWLERLGTHRFVDVHAAPIHDAQGRVASVGTTMLDLTQQRVAEDGLRAGEAKLRAVFSSAAIGIVVATPTERIVDANDAFVALTGHDRESLGRTPLPRLVHPDDAARSETLMRHMLAGDVGDFRMEHRCVRADGRTVWVRRSVSLVRDEHGEPLWIVALVEDIDERRRAELERERLLAILDASPDMVSVETPEGDVVYRNAAARRHLGDSLPAAADPLALVPAPAASTASTASTAVEAVGPAARAAALRHGSWLGEASVAGPDGRPIPVSQLVVSLPGPAGESRYVATVLRDITAQKSSESQLRQRMEELRTANADFERFNRMAVGREERMIELKKEVNELRARLDLSPRYPLRFEVVQGSQPPDARTAAAIEEPPAGPAVADGTR